MDDRLGPRVGLKVPAIAPAHRDQEAAQEVRSRFGELVVGALVLPGEKATGGELPQARRQGCATDSQSSSEVLEPAHSVQDCLTHHQPRPRVTDNVSGAGDW